MLQISIKKKTKRFPLENPIQLTSVNDLKFPEQFLDIVDIWQFYWISFVPFRRLIHFQFYFFFTPKKIKENWVVFFTSVGIIYIYIFVQGTSFYSIWKNKKKEGVKRFSGLKCLKNVCQYFIVSMRCVLRLNREDIKRGIADFFLFLFVRKIFFF